MAVEKITLNLIPTGETPTLHAAQFDKERAFQIELKEGEDDFSPTGYDIELQVRKVDNNIVTAVPSQVSSNIVTFLTTEQMTACSGTNLAELQISKNNMSIATLHFYLVVQRDVLAGGLSSQSEIYDLEEQIAAIVPEVIGDEYYTADQVDEKIAEIPTFDPTNYYDKTQLYTKAETNGLLSQKANTSSLSTVAFTGSYDDLVDHPVIPDVSNYYTKSETYSQAEVNTLLSTKADTSSLSQVATSGSYDDLSDKPTIPSNASVLPISASDSTNTKDYIDSGLSGKQDALSNQTITITPNTSILGNFTGACYQYGKVVCLFVQTASPTSEVAYQSIFLTGLPKPVYGNDNNRVSLIDRATNKPYRFRITDSGQLQEWFNSSGKIPSGADLYGTIVYLAE